MRYIIYLLTCLTMEAVALPVAFILPFFARDGWLPRWLSWFQTPDYSLHGDDGHKSRTKNWPRYFSQVWWLLRNRAYGFKLYVIGCEHGNYSASGNTKIKNRDNAIAGWFMLRQIDDGFWYVKAIIPIGFNYCLQMAFGWQLDAPINGRCLFMFSPRITRFYRV